MHPDRNSRFRAALGGDAGCNSRSKWPDCGGTGCDAV